MVFMFRVNFILLSGDGMGCGKAGGIFLLLFDRDSLWVFFSVPFSEP